MHYSCVCCQKLCVLYESCQCVTGKMFQRKWVFRIIGIYFLSIIVPVSGIYTSNLNDSCIRCLCHVAGCDVAHGCSDGYCGPFYISRVYWVDAGKPTLPDDDPERKEAYEDCARDYHCSIRIVKNYMATFGKDCNGDGVTDCFDYMMINYHGGRACSGSLLLSQLGLRWLDSYHQCKFK